MEISLFYLADNVYGGWATYTAHLFNSLKALGITVQIFKVRSRSQAHLRDFGYGCAYRNVTLDDALAIAQRAASVITALDKSAFPLALPLLRRGAALVVHDPTELRANGDMRQIVLRAPLVLGVRRAILHWVPQAQVVPHPYLRCDDCRQLSWGERSACAVSISRICFDKHTDWLLEANRVLRQPIIIRGMENRTYGVFGLLVRFAEYRHWRGVEGSQTSKSGFPRTDLHAAVKICSGFKFLCDMSAIRGDGGGTQYTFLEGMDAGCICVINRGWILSGDEMQPDMNCLAVDGPVQLVQLLRRPLDSGTVSRLLQGGQRVLAAHAPSVVVPLFLDALRVPRQRRELF